MKTELQDWFVQVIGRLVSKPEAVVVDKTVDEQGVLFTVRVADSDTGKLIGKKGVIAQALRTIVRSAGYMEDMRVSVKIDAPNSKFNLSDDER